MVATDALGVFQPPYTPRSDAKVGALARLDKMRPTDVPPTRTPPGVSPNRVPKWGNYEALGLKPCESLQKRLENVSLDTI